MFVLISVLVSVGTLALLFYFSNKRSGELERKFEILVLLRQLLLLCRQHRATTHQALSHKELEPAREQLANIYDSMISVSNQLIAHSPFENRPMYRILQLKLKSLHKDWDQRTVSRSQITHGKTIRHCMFLMDEIAIAWVIESGREDLSSEYHLNWQQVLDSMEVLTQLRISIQEMHTTDGLMRVKYYCDKTKRKLNQLAMIQPLLMASPCSLKSMSMLDDIHLHEKLELSEGELYQLTTDISLMVSEVYDKMLSDMTSHLYQPLPKLAIS
jgi:hypothetical protein